MHEKDGYVWDKLLKLCVWIVLACVRFCGLLNQFCIFPKWDISSSNMKCVSINYALWYFARSGKKAVFPSIMHVFFYNFNELKKENNIYLRLGKLKLLSWWAEPVIGAASGGFCMKCYTWEKAHSSGTGDTVVCIGNFTRIRMVKLLTVTVP